MDHKWHVHVNPEGNDTYAEMGQRCKSLGGHYNPYLVDLAVSIMALGRQFIRKKSYFKPKFVYGAAPNSPREERWRYATNLTQPIRHKESHTLAVFDPVLMTLFIGSRFFRTFLFIFVSAVWLMFQSTSIFLRRIELLSFDCCNV